uniref:Uncharacterized protein n=1 Tax=Anguilla anguilla TaxID=7936 RepID=A0A0E9TGT5_ANGAN
MSTDSHRYSRCHFHGRKMTRYSVFKVSNEPVCRETRNSLICLNVFSV